MSVDKIDQNEIKKFYNSIDTIWPINDKWHTYTKKCIQNFTTDMASRFNLNSKSIKILNAGSAGEEYSIECLHYHVDIANEKLVNIPNSYTASIEKLPFNNNYFDACICVGSVINYCDAPKVVNEFSRVLKPNGVLILEFDSSSSFEFIFTPPYSQSAHIIKTFYSGIEHRIWVYSESHIKKLLESAEFSVVASSNFHILSSLMYRLTKKSNFSSIFSTMDKLLLKTPLSKFSCNVILCCAKQT